MFDMQHLASVCLKSRLDRLVNERRRAALSSVISTLQLPDPLSVAAPGV